MSISINIIHQDNGGLKEGWGTVYLRTIENRIIRKKSLKIFMFKKDFNKQFNEETKRFKKTFPLSSQYNKIIEDNLNDLSNHGNEISNLPDEKKSFIKFWELCIKNFSNHGTKLKHETVLKKLKNYISFRTKSDLLFKEITPIFLKEFRNYLTTVSDPKILSNNSVIHYLKIIKSIINQSSNDDYYTYIKSPFSGLKFSVEKKSRSVLNEEEINRLLNTTIEDKDLNRNRNIFLFQVFSNGMRVSDVFLLRWNNVVNNRIDYTMFKTGTELSLPINLNMGLILSEVLGETKMYDEIVRTETIQFQDEEKKIHDITLSKLNNVIEYIQNPVSNLGRYKHIMKDFYKNLSIIDKNMGRTIDYKGYTINQSDTIKKNYIDLRENLISQIEKVFLSKISDRIKKEKKKKGNDFIFPVLTNSDFLDIKENNDFSKVNLKQYKSIKHHTIVYNRKLKKIQELCEIETNISSHVSRHSYTNLLLRLDNVNLYDISQSLGHSSIKITENYLRNGFNIEKVDYLNNTISRKYGKHN